MDQMHHRKEIANNLNKLKRRIEFDSELIKNRASLGKRINQLHLENKIPLIRRRKRNINLPNGLFHQHQSILERAYMELRIPREYSVFPLSDITQCNLVNNLSCHTCEEPVKIYQYSEDDPIENLDDYFYFENYSENGCIQSFRLHSFFPLTPASYTSTTLHFDYNFVFQVESSGTYCFLPLTHFIGYVGYWGPGSYPGYFIAGLCYGIYQHGDILAGDHGTYSVEMYPSTNPQYVIPLNLDQSDYDYESSTVYLDSQYHTAEIKVVFTVSFHNGWPYPNDQEHHFILDTYNLWGQGWLMNKYLKWGKKYGLFARLLPWIH